MKRNSLNIILEIGTATNAESLGGVNNKKFLRSDKPVNII